MLNFELAERMDCGREERFACKEQIAEIIRLANVARRSGILALEEELEHTEDALLKEGLLLVTDGTDPEVLAEIMDHYIMSSGCRGKELLQMVIRKEGVLNIQQGINPGILRKLLCSFLGLDLRDEVEAYIRQSGNEQGNEFIIVRNYLLEVRNKEATVEEDGYFQSLAINQNALQRLIGSSRGSRLAMALSCASSGLQSRILNAMSQRNAVAVVKELRMIQSMQLPDGISLERLSGDAQADVVSMVKKLEDSGEIINLQLFRDTEIRWHKSMIKSLSLMEVPKREHKE